MTTTKQLRERWNDPAYIAANSRILEPIFLSRQFSGPADLRAIVVGMDGAAAPLPSYDLLGAKLDGIDFSLAKIACSFCQAEVNNCVFANALFDTCSMTKSRFDACNFTGARLHAPWLTDAVFTDCSFAGAHLGKGGRISHEGGLRVSFVRCDFTHTTFRAIKLQGAKFVDCKFDGAVIRNCFVFNWRYERGAPTQQQFADCEYRGLNAGILE
jgi:uncharacterized protein YjbI with pentapeptide repeats